MERFEDQAWIKPPRLPLGAACRGTCRADSENTIEPDDRTLRDFCNLGYARKHCTHFRDDGEVDAVRFSISTDTGGSIHLMYILERRHSPVRFGPLEYRTADSAFANAEMDGCIAAQARIFVESYLRRKGHA